MGENWGSECFLIHWNSTKTGKNVSEKKDKFCKKKDGKSFLVQFYFLLYLVIYLAHKSDRDTILGVMDDVFNQNNPDMIYI